MNLEKKFKEETGLDAWIDNNLESKIARGYYVEWLEEQVEKQCNIDSVSDTLILTPRDAEIFFNEVMNPKEANEALKKAMLKFITR